MPRKGDSPSEFFLEIAVSATESSLRLAFIGRPLFVTSANTQIENGNKKISLSRSNGSEFVVLRLRRYSPRFSADAFISAMVRRPRAAPLGGFGLPAGECSDWLLCLRMVGNRATNDALCLKLEEARLISDLRLVPILNRYVYIFIYIYSYI